MYELGFNFITRFLGEYVPYLVVDKITEWITTKCDDCADWIDGAICSLCDGAGEVMLPQTIETVVGAAPNFGYIVDAGFIFFSFAMLTRILTLVIKGIFYAQ
jgi:hypothetical protein